MATIKEVLKVDPDVVLEFMSGMMVIAMKANGKMDLNMV